jgi:hypothetical protein
MSAAGVAISVGAVTAANEVFFAPVTGNGTLSEFNWRIIPATAVFALLLNSLEKFSPTLANGIGYTALITALFVSVGNAKSPIQNLNTFLGVGAK